MPESVRRQAFDPFFTTKDVAEGTGLGLSQVYGLVQQSGGVTKIESHIGRGTTVVMYLPHSPSDAIHDQTPLPQPTIPVSQGRRILVLDDDRQVRETVAAMLDTAGYTVVSFASARQALREIGETKPIDLIIVDYAMPDMRGDQFAVEARLQRPMVPVLFITGYAEPTALNSERFVLRKPFSVAALISITEDAIQLVA